MDILNWLFLKKQHLIKSKINNHATDLVVLGAEVPFTERADGYQTYAMTANDFKTEINGYNSYTASITQYRTEDPIVRVLFENSLDVNVTYAREDVGTYSVVFDKPLFNTPYDYYQVLNPTAVNITNGDVFTIQVKAVFYNALIISTYVNDTLADEVMAGLLASSPNVILDVRSYTDPITNP